MDEELEFILKIVDQASGPSRKIAKEVRGVKDEFKAVERQALATERQAQKEARESLKAAKAVAAFGRGVERKSQQETSEALKAAKAVAAFGRTVERKSQQEARAHQRAAKEILRLRDARAEDAKGALAASRALKILDAKKAQAVRNEIIRDENRFIDGLNSVASGALKAGAAVGVLGAAAVGFVGFKIGHELFEMANFTQRSAKAFELLLHDASAADAALAQTRRTAQELGIDLVDTTDSVRKLLAAQFSAQEADTFVRLGADLQAIGADAEEVKRAIMAISQIKAKGKVQQEELLQLAEAGVSLKLVQEELQKSLGKTRDEVAKLQQAGKISSEVGLAAVQAAILRKTGGKVAGDAAKQFADTTLQGSLGKLKNTVQVLFADAADAGGQEFGRIQKIIGAIATRISQIDPKSFLPFIEFLTEGFATVVKFVDKFATGFAEGFNAALPAATEINRLLSDEENLRVIKEVGQFLGMATVAGIQFAQAVTQGIIGIKSAFDAVFGDVFGDIFAILTNTQATAGEKATAIGEAIAHGIAQGIKNAAMAPIDAVTSLGNWIINTAKDVWESHSPSKVFEEIGETIPEGEVRGIQAGADDVVKVTARSLGSDVIDEARSAVGAINATGRSLGSDIAEARNALWGSLSPETVSAPTAPQPMAGLAAVAGGGASPVFNGNFNVTAADTSDRSVEDFAQRAFARFQELWENWQLQQGAPETG